MDKKSFETVLDEIRKVISLNFLNQSVSYEFSSSSFLRDGGQFLQDTA